MSSKKWVSFQIKPKSMGCELLIQLKESISAVVPVWSYSKGVLELYITKEELLDLKAEIELWIEDIK